MLALRSRQLPVTVWESVLPDALHSIRSLLCTSTNETPHERMFAFQRRSCHGYAIPTWLAYPGKVPMKRHVRQSKYDPSVEEVELLDANPQYAHVKLPSGRETTVSLRHLAPRGDVGPVVEPPTCDPTDVISEATDTVTTSSDAPENSDERRESSVAAREPVPPTLPYESDVAMQDSGVPTRECVPQTLTPPTVGRDEQSMAGEVRVRRSGRVRRAPAYLSDYC